MVLTAGGAVFAVGANQAGQLGLGDTLPRGDALPLATPGGA